MCKLNRMISIMQLHIKQYNTNNNTNFKLYDKDDLINFGIISESTKIKSNYNFILLHHKLGWTPDNIIIGNKKQG